MDVSEFVVAALLLELTPGPNMAYLATLSLTRGRAPGLVATIGVAFGLAVHAIFAALGAAVLIQQFMLLNARKVFYGKLSHSTILGLVPASLRRSQNSLMHKW